MITTNRKLNILVFTVVFTLISFPFVKTFASDITPTYVIELVNKARNIGGLEPLNENSKLDKVAADKLEDMVENKYFAHTSPKGVSPWHWFIKNKYNYEYAGENLAIDFMAAEKQHEAWMKSPTHRKNILNPNFTEIGVAVGTGEIEDHVSIITVQVFGAPAYSEKTANKEENFFSAQKSSSNISGTVLAAKEMKIEKLDADKNAYKNSENQLENLRAGFVSQEGWLSDAGWISSWLILIVFVVINPLIVLVAIFRIKYGAKQIAGKMEMGLKNNFIEKRQFR